MERLTRSKAIRAKCLDCCCGSAPEVRKCPVKDCPLWTFRMGKEVKSEINSEVQNDVHPHDL